jgi:hypothetical protein
LCAAVDQELQPRARNLFDDDDLGSKKRKQSRLDQNRVPLAGVHDAALYFEPTDVHTAAKLIIRVLTNVDVADELRSIGRERALQLDWKEHFSQLIGHYRALAIQ